MERLTDEQLIQMWNESDGAISWLIKVEEELKLRGYRTRSTDPSDGLPRIAGERLLLTPKS